jgi:hypothetical protein
VQFVEAALERLAQRRELLSQPALASFARTSGSVVPATSASSIARPDAPSKSEATLPLLPVRRRPAPA